MEELENGHDSRGKLSTLYARPSERVLRKEVDHGR